MCLVNLKASEGISIPPSSMPSNGGTSTKPPVWCQCVAIQGSNTRAHGGEVGECCTLVDTGRLWTGLPRAPIAAVTQAFPISVWISALLEISTRRKRDSEPPAAWSCNRLCSASADEGWQSSGGMVDLGMVNGVRH